MKLVDETQFRVVFGVFWALFLALRLYFLLKVKGAKKSFERHEPQEMFFTYAFGFAVLLMPVYVVSRWFDFAHVPLPSWVRYFLGCPLLIAYLSLFAWTHYTLGRNWSAFLDIYEDHFLVINGPYRYVRHPMYSSWFLSGIGYFFLSANWFITSFYLVTLTLMYVYRVSAEERMMIERFGDSYREYMESTGRLLPRLPRNSVRN